MMKIDRMPRDFGVINYTALHNHNECVDKINEIIDVLNAWEGGVHTIMNERTDKVERRRNNENRT